MPEEDLHLFDLTRLQAHDYRVKPGNDERKIVLATHPRPSFALFPPRSAKTEGRRSADRRIQPLSAPHKQTLPPECARARKRVQRDALASRRSTAALAKAFTSWLSFGPRFPGLGRALPS
jgi:hypothetical protein